jgi:hypothetical protein
MGCGMGGAAKNTRVANVVADFCCFIRSFCCNAHFRMRLSQANNGAIGCDTGNNVNRPNTH